MGNCLVTKLKQVVNNDNLEFLDALQFKVDWPKDTRINKVNIIIPNSGSYIWNFGGPGCTVKILSNGAFYRNSSTLIPGNEMILPDNPAVYNQRLDLVPVDSSKPTELLIYGLSSIERLWFSYGAPITCKFPETLKYSGDDNQFLQSEPNGSVMELYCNYDDNSSPVKVDYIADYVGKSYIKSFRPTGTKTPSNSSPVFLVNATSLANLSNLEKIPQVLYIIGDVANIANLTSLYDVYMQYKETVGDLASLGKWTGLTYLNCMGSNIEGSIDGVDGLVYAQYNNGRKSASGSSRIRLYLNDVYFEGVQISISGKYLAWDDGGSAPTNIRLENS